MLNVAQMPGTTDFERREFGFPQSKPEIDALIDWLDGGDRVAIVSDGNGHSLAAFPARKHRMHDDAILCKAYLPHWELDGFAVEDMPTVHNLIQAAKEDLLLQCAREILQEAPSPCGNPNIDGAVAEIGLWLRALRSYEIDSCDAEPFVVTPLATHRLTHDDTCMLKTIEARAFALQGLQADNPAQRDLDTHILWSRILGYKAWFDGVGIRDSYRALAWVVCKLLRRNFVDFGIWAGRQPHTTTTDETRLLDKSAQEDLNIRMRDLAKRIAPLEKLEAVTFRVDQDAFRAFEAACRNSGLSVRNALHIAILRSIDDSQGFIARCNITTDRGN